MQEDITIYRVSNGVDTGYIVLSIYEDVHTHRRYSGNSVQCPPVIKKATVEVAFPWRVFAFPDTVARFPFHPLLAVAVLRILDVLARMKKCPAVEAPIDISGMRDIVPGDDLHQLVILVEAHLTPVLSAGSALGGQRKLLDPLQGIVYLCFCHIPFRLERSASQGTGHSNCRAVLRGIPFAHACFVFAAVSSASCEHILSFGFWCSTFSIKSLHRAG